MTSPSKNSNYSFILKHFSVVIALVYVFGFLVLSLRLSSLGLYIKDFFTVDYIKAGILFIIFVGPNFVLFELLNSFTDDRFYKKVELLHLSGH